MRRNEKICECAHSNFLHEMGTTTRCLHDKCKCQEFKERILMKNPAAIFDGLHGKDIVLICSLCGERHYPRCKAPEAVSLGSKGGKARAKKYTKAQLSAMGKKGGRPKKKPLKP